MATLKERLEQEKCDFEKALKGEFIKSNGESLNIMNIQAKFIQDAIPSINYMLMILNGDVILPNENESVNTSWGKVFEWMQGSIVNITMAETIVYGKWGNVTDCFKSMYMSLADEVNMAEDDGDDRFYGDDDWDIGPDNQADSQSGLADEVNEAEDDDDDWFHGDDDWDIGTNTQAESQSGLADEVNKADDDDDYHVRYCGAHGECCDCLDIPHDGRDI